jgi:hypothetical protein
MPGDKENMDDFFEAIFGSRPTKRGKGYELLVAAVLKIAQKKGAFPNARVLSDQYLKGALSGSTYQLDALVDGDETAFVEAKDYTERNEPVGRGDVQKLAGALLDLPVDRGVLASSTGFTKPSKQYAVATETMAGQKPIELANVRASVQEDEAGRIRRLILRFHFHQADFERAKWTPIFSSAAKTTLAKLGAVRVGLDAFYRSDGSVLQSVHDFTLHLSGKKTGWDARTITGTHVFAEPAYLRVGTDLVPIEGLGYDVPIDVTDEEISIEAEGVPKVLVKFENGRVDTLITDDELKSVRFEESGEVIVDEGASPAHRVRRHTT